VLGDEFDLIDLTAASGLTQAQAVDALDAGLRARLIEEASPAGRYRFGHALLREAVVARLSAGRRALMHRRVAEALERLPPDRLEPRLTELAWHLAEAAPTVDPHKTAEYALRAAEHSLARLAYEEAAAILARGLEALSDEAGDRRVRLLLALGDAQARAGDPGAARASFDEAARGARSLGDAELLARGALGMAGIGAELARGGPRRRGRPGAGPRGHRVIRSLAGEARLPAYRWYGPMWRAMLAGFAGRLAEAERLTEEGARMGRAAGDDNAELLFAVQRLTWRFQGSRLTDEEVAAIETGAAASAAGTAWRGWLAKVHAQRSDEARAREELDRALAALPELARDANWLASRRWASCPRSWASFTRQSASTR
jgi:hypothetical protein